MTYVSVRTSSLGVGILAEKHRRVATKVAFRDRTDLRKSIFAMKERSELDTKKAHCVFCFLSTINLYLEKN